MALGTDGKLIYVIEVDDQGTSIIKDFGSNVVKADNSVGKLAKSSLAAGKQAAAGMTQALDATMTWHKMLKLRMGPLMRQLSAEGKTHGESHTLAIRQISAEWKDYKKTGVLANAAVDNAVDTSTKMLRKLKTAAQQGSAQFKDAYGIVGVRSFKSIRREINLVEAATNRLRNSGKLSPSSSR